MIYRIPVTFIFVAAMAFPVFAQCGASSSGGGTAASFSSGSVGGSGSTGAASSSFAPSTAANFSVGSLSRLGSTSPSRSAYSRQASGPLSGYESFSTPMGNVGYRGSVAGQQAAFYRYPMIQKSANISVRTANRSRVEELRQLKRESRLAKKQNSGNDPIYPRLASRK